MSSETQQSREIWFVCANLFGIHFYTVRNEGRYIIYNQEFNHIFMDQKNKHNLNGHERIELFTIFVVILRKNVRIYIKYNTKTNEYLTTPKPFLCTKIIIFYLFFVFYETSPVLGYFSGFCYNTFIVFRDRTLIFCTIFQFNLRFY